MREQIDFTSLMSYFCNCMLFFTSRLNMLEFGVALSFFRIYVPAQYIDEVCSTEGTQQRMEGNKEE